MKEEANEKKVELEGTNPQKRREEKYRTKKQQAEGKCVISFERARTRRTRGRRKRKFSRVLNQIVKRIVSS